MFSCGEKYSKQLSTWYRWRARCSWAGSAPGGWWQTSLLRFSASVAPATRWEGSPFSKGLLSKSKTRRRELGTEQCRSLLSQLMCHRLTSTKCQPEGPLQPKQEPAFPSWDLPGLRGPQPGGTRWPGKGVLVIPLGTRMSALSDFCALRWGLRSMVTPWKPLGEPHGNRPPTSPTPTPTLPPRLPAPKPSQTRSWLCKHHGCFFNQKVSSVLFNTAVPPG